MYTNKDFDQQTDYCGAVLTCDYCKTEYKLVENDSISPIQICKHQTFCMDCINDVNTRVIGDMERSYCIYCILDGETYDLWPDDDYGAWTSADIIELGVQDVLKNGQEYTQYKNTQYRKKYNKNSYSRSFCTQFEKMYTCGVTMANKIKETYEQK